MPRWRALGAAPVLLGLCTLRLAVVTAGVGSGTMPLRLGAPPDWWLITLRRGRR